MENKGFLQFKIVFMITGIVYRRLILMSVDVRNQSVLAPKGLNKQKYDVVILVAGLFNLYWLS